MKKIRTIYYRNYRTGLVERKISHGMEWVFDTNVTPTAKYDGMSVMIKNGKVYRRFDCNIDFRKGTLTRPPYGFIPCEMPDMKTGHWAGWYPIDLSESHNALFAEAVSREFGEDGIPGAFEETTYELIGPNVRGNKYDLVHHDLVEHGCQTLEGLAFMHTVGGMKAFDLLQEWFVANPCHEGIVFYSGTTPVEMGKIKQADFGLPWLGSFLLNNEGKGE